MRTTRNRFGIAALTLLAGVTVSPVAEASDGFDAQTLRPGPSLRMGYTGGTQASALEADRMELGLFLQYGRNPLVVESKDGDEAGALISDQVVSHLLFTYGLFGVAELGLDLPLVLFQAGDAIDAPGAPTAGDGFGVGDMRVAGKWSLLDPQWVRADTGPALAVLGSLSLPTGSASSYQGGELSGLLGVAFDFLLGEGRRVGANVTYRIRPERQDAFAQVNDELGWTLSGLFPMDASQVWWIVPELRGAAGILSDEVTLEDTPLEGGLAVRMTPDDQWLGQAGASVGILPGYGTPDARVWLGASWTLGSDDRDGDGLKNRDDKCPDAPEDFDGHEDADGCPDPDNDGDGVPDRRDACPMDPEDEDGFEDGDGCPDPDNDGDGLLDGADACPNEAEDLDGYEDADGCADPDNDGDGIPDVDDKCPLKAEDKDAFEDEDGCPDPDNDRDGIPDVRDQCPNDAEDYDGFEDADGCPEEGTGKVALTCEKIEIKDTVQFDTNKDTIKAESFGLLDQVAGVLKSVETIRKVRVEGHTDDRGPDAANLDLSKRRAASVRAYLIRAGVPENRLESEGYGETKPIETNKTAAGRAKNRRVEFWVVEQDARCEDK